MHCILCRSHAVWFSQIEKDRLFVCAFHAKFGLVFAFLKRLVTLMEIIYTGLRFLNANPFCATAYH